MFFILFVVGVLLIAFCNDDASRRGGVLKQKWDAARLCIWLAGFISIITGIVGIGKMVYAII